jgi:hypothetical protein
MHTVNLRMAGSASTRDAARQLYAPVFDRPSNGFQHKAFNDL